MEHSRLKRAFTRLAFFAGGDVPQIGYKDGPIVHVNNGDAHLNRKFRAVFAHGRQFKDPSKNDGLAGPTITFHAIDVFLTESRRDNRVRETFPDHLHGGVSKNFFGRRIEFENSALLVRDDDAVVRGVEDRAQTRFAFLELVFGDDGLQHAPTRFGQHSELFF